MKVCKFGGSSLADGSQISKACRLVAADSNRRFVVVSAPGKRYENDTKVTDLLIAAGEAVIREGYREGLADEVLARFREIHADLGLEHSLLDLIREDIETRLQADCSHHERFMDAVKAAGEDNCAKLFAAALTAAGTPAVYVSPRDAGLLMTEEYGGGRMLPESSASLAKLGEYEQVVVFPGFFGYSREGHVVTFSRGGSDITGSILAAHVGAELYENFTDVDGVLAVDPRIVPEACPIEEITYREMRELSYSGFSVLHDEAIVPAVRAGIPIRICNTNHPEATGTTIVPRHHDVRARVVGIASGEPFCTIYVSKYLMNREIGFGRRLLAILEDEGLSYEHMPSGIDDASIVLDESGFGPEQEAHVVARISDELDCDDVAVERGLALIMIVGEGMRYNVGMASLATQALAEAGVNIEMMNQGSSEINMMFGVKKADKVRAVRALYAAFFDEDQCA